MEYLLVKFAEDRGVKIDGRPPGDRKTNITLELEGGTHAVTLERSDDCIPIEHTIMLEGTTLIRPMEIVFVKRPSSMEGIHVRGIEPPEPWPQPV